MTTVEKFASRYGTIAREWFSPLAASIAEQFNAKRKVDSQAVVMIGINGSQGSGKSTLANWLAAELTQRHSLDIAVMSIDNFYLSSSQRQTLANQIHPLLRTRGVPGTHDTVSIKQVLRGFSSHQMPITVPRFDKATDNPSPEETWPVFDTPVDIVLFEGWCWGVRHQNAELLRNPVNALEAEFDTDATWRDYVNEQLTTAYEPLYPFMDRWVMLKAPCFDAVFNWRMEQEQALARITANDALPLLEPAHLKRFIEHYQRLTEHSLRTLPQYCDDVFELDSQRNILSHVRADKQFD